MRTKSIYPAMAIVGLALGILLSFQFRVTREAMEVPQISRVQSMSEMVAAAREERDKKQEQVDAMRAELDRTAAGPEQEALKGQLEKYRIEAGLTAVTGPGVEVTLNDSNAPVEPGEDPNLYVLHDIDVLWVLNELRAAGAEALSINGQRVLATSEIRCTGPTILINKNQRLTPPFVISAIGNQDNLINSLKMRNGVIDRLQFFNIQVNVKKVSQIDIPAYAGSISFDYARPVSEVQSKQ